MPSFDIVSEVNKQEIKNVTDQVNKEVISFLFKGELPENIIKTFWTR